MDAPAISSVREVLDAVERSLALESLQQLDERALALAADHVVGVLETFFGHERGVGSSDRDRDARSPYLFGQRVRGRSGGGDRGDAHEIRAQHRLHVDRGDIFDEDPDIVAQVAEDGAEEDRSEPRNRNPAVYVQVGGLRLYQDDLAHGISPPGAPRHGDEPALSQSRQTRERPPDPACPER